jgi:hypothetical protein
MVRTMFWRKPHYMVGAAARIVGVVVQHAMVAAAETNHVPAKFIRVQCNGFDAGIETRNVAAASQHANSPDCHRGSA